MTKKEFSIFAMAMKTYYPREKLLPNDKAMELWFRQLEDIPYPAAELILNRWVAQNKWSPSIADLREMAAELQSGGRLAEDWSEAWEKVLQAVRLHGIYNPEEALASLDGLTARVVRRLGFQSICLSENITADRANFRTIYEKELEREKKKRQLPAGILKEVERLRLEGGADNGKDA